jgi:hypothetical protein
LNLSAKGANIAQNKEAMKLKVIGMNCTMRVDVVGAVVIALVAAVVVVVVAVAAEVAAATSARTATAAARTDLESSLRFP